MPAHWAGLQADKSNPIGQMWADDESLVDWKVNGVGVSQLDKAYKSMKWNLPGKQVVDTYTGK